MKKKNSQNRTPQGGGGNSAFDEDVLNKVSTLNRDIVEIKQQLAQIGNAVGMLANGHNQLAGFAKALQQGLKRFIPRALLPMRVALAEHCNLNCRGCDHFAPIAEPQFADFTSLAMDFARLSALFDGRADEILLMGGEPLLHPEIEKFMVMARKNFQEAKIEIVTNGVLLMKKSESFWKTCRERDIAINVTKYPISLDFEAMEKKSASYGVKYHYFDGAGDIVKTLFQHKLSPKKTQDAWTSYLLCGRANNCIYLQDGRLYTCTVAPTVRHFDRRFGTNLFNAEENSIDIYKAKSAQEIMEFLAKPIPFCSHCRMAETVQGIKWCTSKKTIDEWT